MKKWCKHIRWWPAEDGYIGAWVTVKFDINGSSDVPKLWICCPICAAKRPVSTKPKKKGNK